MTLFFIENDFSFELVKENIGANLQRIIELFNPKNCHKSSQKYRFGNRDPEQTYSGSRIRGQKGTGSRIKTAPDPGSGVKKAPNPGSGTLIWLAFFIG
jgi:hypothetical protein